MRRSRSQAPAIGQEFLANQPLLASSPFTAAVNWTTGERPCIVFHLPGIRPVAPELRARRNHFNKIGTVNKLLKNILGIALLFQGKRRERWS